MSYWREDKKKSDRFIPHIKSILGQEFIGEASYDDDATKNTDLIVLRIEPIRFACRVRAHHYYQKYPNEFTIRSRRPSGQQTEFYKILAGFGDFFFYGFSNEIETRVDHWVLVDLSEFRKYLWKCHSSTPIGGKHPWEKNVKSNNDNSSDFIPFDWRYLPRQIVRKNSFNFRGI